MWVIRSRKVTWPATLINLYLLLNAVRALHKFTPLQMDDYAITSLASAEQCVLSRALPPAAPPANATASSNLIDLALGTIKTGLHALQQDITSARQAHRADDLASIMRECRGQLSQAAGFATGLQQAQVVYFQVAYAFISLVICLDCLRYCGCWSSLVDILLGFRSERVERFRLAYLCLMVVPFLHLSWLLSRPIPLPCCEGTPKIERVWERVCVLAWLCLLVSYCLFSDAHNNGFFLLRSRDAGACRLLRPNLGSGSVEETKGLNTV